MASNLSSNHRALVLEAPGADFQMKTVPVPKLEHGSAIVCIEAAGTNSYMRDVYKGTRPDATLLQLGQLVYIDCVVRGRDDPSVLFLSAISSGMTYASKRLMADVWRDGPFAEYMKAPLENCFPLNEAKLCQGFGYSIPELLYMGCLLVAYGGLRDIKLEAGETVVISPATGGFGGAGVQVAVSKGARVIAMGRNEKELARIKAHAAKTSPRANVETVKISGDVATDTAALKAHGSIDAVLDFTPVAAGSSTHLKSAVNSLRHGGRCSAMGFALDFISPWSFVGNNITIKGKLMYERADILQFVKMLEAGLFPHGGGLVDTKSFKLDDWKEALDVAAEHTGIGKHVVLTP